MFNFPSTQQTLHMNYDESLVYDEMFAEKFSGLPSRELQSQNVVRSESWGPVLDSGQ